MGERISDREISLDLIPLSVLEAVDDGVSIIGVDMRLIYANQAIRDIYGEDVVGDFCFAAFKGLEGVCQDCLARQVFRNGEAVTGTQVSISKTSGRRFTETSASPFRDMSGKVVAVIEIRRDITERKLIEAEMDKRNRETRALADIAMALNHPVGLQETLSVSLYRSIDITGADVGTIRILDEETRELVLWDKFSVRKLEFTPEMLKPQRLGEGIIGRIAAEGDIAFFDDLTVGRGADDKRLGRAAVKRGVRSMAIIPILLEDRLMGVLSLGSRRHSHFSSFSKNLLRAIAVQAGVAIENARVLDKQKEGRKTARATVPAILTFDRDGLISEASQGALSLLGRPRGEVIGSDPNELECCPQLAAIIPEVLGGKEVAEFEHVVIAGDSSRVSVATSAVPIMDGEGEVIGAVAVSLRRKG